MRPWSYLAIVTVCLAGAACAAAPATPPAGVAPAAAAQPPAPPPLDPVGTFDFSTAVENTIVNGTVVIEKREAGYAGMITTTATEPVSVQSVSVDGQKLTVVAQTPDGPVTFIMEFKGDDFSGSWSYAGMYGTHTGKRRKA